ncbi:MAG: formylmethanofuran dehydrogenase subunit E family protein [Candidatus Omnitrophota bacterium]
MKEITLKETVRFHGHLGPYLTLGVLAGELALKKLKAKKYFGLKVKVSGANKKPKSCLIDGLQLSTGATYGKGNIEKLNGSGIRLEFYNLVNHKKISLKLKDNLIKDLKETKTHRDSELLAKKLYSTDYYKLFDLAPNT